MSQQQRVRSRWWVALAAFVFVLAVCAGALAAVVGALDVAFHAAGTAAFTGVALCVADELGASS